jgi:hypothetical protein
MWTLTMKLSGRWFEISRSSAHWLYGLANGSKTHWLLEHVYQDDLNFNAILDMIRFENKCHRYTRRNVF